MACLFVAVFALTWQAKSQWSSSYEQSRRLDALIAKFEAKPQATSIDLQEKCAKQAREQFRLDGWEREGSATIQNHYSEKHGKCFMFVVAVDLKSGDGLTSKTLTDAFERRIFATYLWRADKVKKYWEVPPIQCEVTLPSGETVRCKSDEEFEDLVKAYLE